MTAGTRFGVLLPLVFREPFDYAAPPGMQLAPGDWVEVPFGRKSVWGVVWGPGAGEIEDERIKRISRIAAHLPPMSEPVRAFIDWVAWYTLAPLGLVLKMALSLPEALEPPKLLQCYKLSSALLPQTHEAGRKAADIKLTPARLRVIAYLWDGGAHSLKELGLHAKVTPAVLRELVKCKVLLPAETEQVVAIAPPPVSLPQAAYALSPDQQKAADSLHGKLARGFSVTLLDGVTGSGKTEVYFDAIAHCLEQGRQALVLLPEIALSVQWLARFEKRFGFAPGIWHSGITPAARRDCWVKAALGASRVVVGARSALFLPLKQLGLVVVDEEHDTSYKQEDGVIYQARDMAVARARHEKIPALLVSATPSLETEFNIAQGRYGRIHLPSRYGAAQLPDIKLLDMRAQKLPAGSWLSDPLKEALIATLAQGRQALLFMNRRGYAPLLLCKACGHRIQCPHCSAFLVLHRARGKLLCHHCGHMAPMPQDCPQCKKENTIIAYGPGVERIAEEARALLPDARIAVMTSDLIDTPAKAAEIVNDMSAGRIDLLIGTQMIAKGHHFAGLALVGVMDADMGLAGGDLRAGERTYQLLHQLAGRAGREKTRGEVWLQTYMPEHPVMRALAVGDRDRYMALEAEMRAEAEMPPYGKLAAVIIEGAKESEVVDHARHLVRQAALLSPHPLILGPAPAPLFLLRGRYRYRILVKAARSFALQEWLSSWLLAHKTPASLKVRIDVEPYSFL